MEHKWIRIRLTTSQHEALRARAKKDRRTIQATIEQCLIDTKCINEPSEPYPDMTEIRQTSTLSDKPNNHSI